MFFPTLFCAKKIGLPCFNSKVKEISIAKININFHNPLYINEKITVTGKVKKKDSRFKIVEIIGSIKNDLKIISTATIIINVTK